MKDYYTREQAMELLGITSINVFLQLARKYPNSFVKINQIKHWQKKPRYDKDALDNFHQMREQSKQEKP